MRRYWNLCRISSCTFSPVIHHHFECRKKLPDGPYKNYIFYSLYEITNGIRDYFNIGTCGRIVVVCNAILQVSFSPWVLNYRWNHPGDGTRSFEFTSVLCRPRSLYPISSLTVTFHVQLMSGGTTSASSHARDDLTLYGNGHYTLH